MGRSAGLAWKRAAPLLLHMLQPARIRRPKHLASPENTVRTKNPAICTAGLKTDLFDQAVGRAALSLDEL